MPALHWPLGTLVSVAGFLALGIVLFGFPAMRPARLIRPQRDIRPDGTPTERD